MHRKRKHSQFFLNCFSLTIRYLNFRGFLVIFLAHSPSVSSVFCFSVLLFLFFFTLTSIFILIFIFALPDGHCHERHHHCHPEFGFFLTRFLYRNEPVGRDCITSQRPNNAIWVPAAPGVRGGNWGKSEPQLFKGRCHSALNCHSYPQWRFHPYSLCPPCGHRHLHSISMFVFTVILRALTLAPTTSAFCQTPVHDSATMIVEFTPFGSCARVAGSKTDFSGCSNLDVDAVASNGPWQMCIFFLPVYPGISDTFVCIFVCLADTCIICRSARICSLHSVAFHMTSFHVNSLHFALASLSFGPAHLSSMFEREVREMVAGSLPP